MYTFGFFIAFNSQLRLNNHLNSSTNVNTAGKETFNTYNLHRYIIIFLIRLKLQFQLYDYIYIFITSFFLLTTVHFIRALVKTHMCVINNVNKF